MHKINVHYNMFIKFIMITALYQLQSW